MNSKVLIQTWSVFEPRHTEITLVDILIWMDFLGTSNSLKETIFIVYHQVSFRDINDTADFSRVYQVHLNWSQHKWCLCLGTVWHECGLRCVLLKYFFNKCNILNHITSYNIDQRNHVIHPVTLVFLCDQWIIQSLHNRPQAGPKFPWGNFFPSSCRKFPFSFNWII